MFLARIGVLTVMVSCWQANSVVADESMPLWPNGAPGALGEDAKDRPMLTMYTVEAATPRVSILICPGGGYGGLAMGHEGEEIARWFNSLGVTAFVLDYRHRGKGYGHPAPLLDARRALSTIRANADKWNLISDRIGVIGFSAGGHLASSLGVHYTTGDENAEDPIEQASCRPDYMVLCYPVIGFGEAYTHQGSQKNLLGEQAEQSLIEEMSTQRQITKDTPPTFLWHTTADKGVPPENSVQFYLGLVKAGVPAELHIFEKGRHGLGLAQSTPGANDWPSRLAAWMRNRGIIAP